VYELRHFNVLLSVPNGVSNGVPNDMPNAVPS
jgi:hypothetical protein